MKKYILMILMVLGFVACSDPAKEAEVKTLENKVTDLQNVISKTKDSISALEEKERALKKELESLDMVP
jgi:peptidoglycan hydrolase CwlO-like protein